MNVAVVTVITVINANLSWSDAKHCYRKLLKRGNFSDDIGLKRAHTSKHIRYKKVYQNSVLIQINNSQMMPFIFSTALQSIRKAMDNHRANFKAFYWKIKETSKYSIYCSLIIFQCISSCRSKKKEGGSEYLRQLSHLCLFFYGCSLKISKK